ncbi:MAG: ATP-binding protein [Pseudomonadota bacterium]
MSSMAAWFASFRMVERTPRAQQIAAQIVSVVTITRAALTHSAPDRRTELLIDLASNEGIRIYLLENTDKIEPPEETPIYRELQSLVRERLGEDTRFAKKMNNVPGFWISFEIDGDQYWLKLDEGRLEPATGLQLLGWAAITLFLTLLGAAFISKLINEPLARLSSAARMLAKGKQPKPLPEAGPNEIKETNISFNQMVEDLVRIESDRAVILAGISHDLRTPLARMQLEVEMATLSDDARLGMQSDLSQMDAIIGQFLVYAKPSEELNFEFVSLSDMLEQIVEEYSRQSDIIIRAAIHPNMEVQGNTVELHRLFTNIMENARRYGKTADTPITHLDIRTSYKNKEKKQGIMLSFRDHGQGVPEADLPRLLRPFTRLDAARSQANGSGLGLAIVERIVKRHHGKLRISNHANGGFAVLIAFP